MAQNKHQKLELTWIGKGEEPKLEPRILIEQPEYSYGDSGSENMLIHGDNLLALKALEQDFTGKIKCIYIDPPYNTGNALEHYDDFLEHSTWLNLMYQRLNMLNSLLDENNGSSIWVHLDDAEVHYCKVIMDQIFRRENFIAHITYERSGIGGIGQGGTFITTGEHILVYQRGLMNFNQIYSYEPIELAVMKRYNKYIVDFGERELIKEFVSKSNNETVKIFKHNGYKIESVSFKNYEKNKKDIDLEYSSHFQSLFRTFLIQKENSFQQDIISQMDKDSLYSMDYTPSRGKNLNKPTTLYYLNRELVGWLKEAAVLNEDGEVVKTSKLTNIWAHKDIPKADLPNEGGVTFPRGKKPEQLIKRILEMSTNPGDWVLDSFLGSGTTLAVAHKMNRKWIGVELGEQAYTHCIPRLQSVVNGSDKSGISKLVNWKGGSGFKFYTLATSLLNRDKFGNWVISCEYNAQMLAAAMAKQEGFRFNPHDSLFWKQGNSSENDYIFTTTQFITIETLDQINDEMLPGESLLICCKSFQKECKSKFGAITIKKIPQILLGRCEFGKDDYSLNIVNMPVDEETEIADYLSNTTYSEPSPNIKPDKRSVQEINTTNKKKDNDMLSLFD
jgi:adenine-specific DNA-methyltransferase